MYVCACNAFKRQLSGRLFTTPQRRSDPHLAASYNTPLTYIVSSIVLSRCNTTPIPLYPLLNIHHTFCSCMYCVQVMCTPKPSFHRDSRVALDWAISIFYLTLHNATSSFFISRYRTINFLTVVHIKYFYYSSKIHCQTGHSKPGTQNVRCVFCRVTWVDLSLLVHNPLE